MANNIDLVTKMLPLIDEVYKQASKSAVLEAPAEFVRQTADAKTVQIAKLNLVGLGDYDRETGYPEGDVSLTWETHTFENDRGRRFSFDRMDDIESFSLLAARAVGIYLTKEVVPEVDAYRFSKIASKEGVELKEETLSDTNTKKAINNAIVALEEKEVDDASMVLFVTPTVAQLLSENVARTTMNNDKGVNNIITEYNDIPLIRVPQTRFYKGITLNAGLTSSAGGYSKTSSTGADINFILMDKQAAYNVTKLNVAKLIDPDTNQSKDAWQFDFRLYHDTFVLDNKVNGIYVSHKTAG